MVAPQRTGRITAASLGPLTTVLGSGGQGTVYAVSGTVPAAYKEYDAAASGNLDVSALEAMVTFLAGLSPAEAKDIRESAAWPTAIVEREGRVRGFLMAQVPREFLVRIRFPRGYQEKFGQVQLLLNDTQYLAARDLMMDDRFRLELLRDTAHTIEVFHGLGVVVGDLSPNNLFFSPARRPRCFFIDCDAMRLGDVTVLPQVETDDWQVPRAGEQLGTRATDSYKFTLLCVRLFAGDQSTRDPLMFQRAGRGLYELAVRGLSPDARQRPSLREWRTALDAALPAQAPLRIPVRQVPGQAGPRLPRQPQRVVPGPPLRTRFARAVWRGLRQQARRTRPGRVIRLLLVLLLAGWVGPKLPAVGDWWEAAVSAFSTTEEARTETEQAAGVALLLADSGRNRQQVIAAIANARDCTGLSSAVSDLSEASAGRAAALERARALRTDRLPDGAELKEQLINALTHSRAADDAYGRWAEALRSQGCGSRTMKGANRKKGDAQSKQATAAKKRVAAIWNPTAARHGHPTVTYLEI